MQITDINSLGQRIFVNHIKPVAPSSSPAGIKNIDKSLSAGPNKDYRKAFFQTKREEKMKLQAIFQQAVSLVATQPENQLSIYASVVSLGLTAPFLQ